MVNKRGFLKIVEATIAIMLILSVLIVLSAPNNQKKENIRELLPPILKEMGENRYLRVQILSYNSSLPLNEESNRRILENITNFIAPRIRNPNLNFTSRICDLNIICSLENYPPGKEVFATERAVSTTIGELEFEPKKIKIFLWREL